jgi:hypothetical protein
MAFNTFPSKGGIPSGNTAGRPSNPAIGDTYYNGQVEALEIYNGTTWKVVKSEGFPPDAPTISSVTDSSTSLAYSSTAGTLDVVFVPAATGGTATQYNAYTTVGGHSGFTTVGNTVTITGLTPGTAYSVYGNAANGSGTSTNTATASPVTPTTLPEVRTIGTATASTSSNAITVSWTNANNGAKNLSAITITPFLNGTTAATSRTAATTSSTSYTFTEGQLTGNASYTFKVKATNANGTCADSTASNSATMPNLVVADIMLVAGGGGGGASYGGGGGAGGFRVLNSSLTAGTSYTVTVGAAGAAVSGTYPNVNRGGKGGNSSFSGSGFTTISATGGGGGGAWNVQTSGGTGGSGGGGTLETSAGGVGNEGGYTPVEGYNGATSISGTAYGGDGGGGAGGEGIQATSSQPGNGGPGTSAYSSWGAATSSGQNVSGTYWYAGGGGGGYRVSAVGGNGGGGNGNGGIGSGGGVSGTTNTGGGGGGGGGDGETGSAGGSGLVIIRLSGSVTAASTTGSPTRYETGGYTYYKYTGNGSVTF